MNALRLHGTLVAKGALRQTPAGLHSVQCEIDHDAMVDEASGPRRVQMRLTVQAYGALAQSLTDIELGSLIGIEGYLAQKSAQDRTLCVHALRLVSNFR